MTRQRPISVPLVPDSPEWHAWRRTGIGSSDIPVITGDAPWGDPVSLYQEKLGYGAGRVETDSMAAGKWLEDLIAQWYAGESGRKVRKRNVGLRSRTHGFAIASPDRFVPGRGLLEVKIASDPGDRWGQPGTAEIPDTYFEQVQWQAHVADVDVVDVAVFFTRTRRREIYSVEREPEVISELLEYGEAFWRHVVDRTPPEPVERALRLPLRADEVEADEEVIELVQTIGDLEARIALESEGVDQLRAQIKSRLVDVGGARGPGFRIHYRYNRDSTQVAWEKVAGAYRERLLSVFRGSADGDGLSEAEEIAELDRIVAELTSTKAGARPLSIRRTKEKADA